MKRIISILAVLCLILSCGFVFASCKKDDETKTGSVEKITTTSTAKEEINEVETDIEENDDQAVTEEQTEIETVILDVTDKEGNDQTTVIEYSVKGGSDPYVEDIF